MKIAIEAQRIFRPNKHGMDFVALETIRELQKRNDGISIMLLSLQVKIAVWKIVPISQLLKLNILPILFGNK